MWVFSIAYELLITCADMSSSRMSGNMALLAKSGTQDVLYMGFITQLTSTVSFK